MTTLINLINELFHIDTLCLVIVLLATFIGMNIYKYAQHYLEGDAYQTKFLRNIVLLTISICVMSTADNIYLLWITWIVNSLLLRNMMKHKESWQAANNASLLTLSTLSIGITTLFIACVLLSWNYNSYSISTMIASNAQNATVTLFAMICIILTAMTQSAIWPFHRWMISSLNSPTPVSAMMHAGLVNGGGFLLTRFSPLLLQSQTLLSALFIVGLITALLGATWKLIQPDVKRMLACSTISQMGYMTMQCGLGLFPAAIAHLFWHAMFKSFLFLNVNQIGKKTAHYSPQKKNLLSWMLAAITGCISVLIFNQINNLALIANNSMLFIQAILLITALHAYLSLEMNTKLSGRLCAMTLVSILAAFYGISFHVFEILFISSLPLQAQAISGIYLVGLALLIASWAMKLNQFRWIPSPLFNKLYVTALNSSQANPDTITACRNDYRYQEKSHA